MRPDDRTVNPMHALKGRQACKWLLQDDKKPTAPAAGFCLRKEKYESMVIWVSGPVSQGRKSGVCKLGCYSDLFRIIRRCVQFMNRKGT